jgi:kinesin family protein C1
MAVRRRLNNEIQELKGSIRVYCRVRPLSAAEQRTAAAAGDTASHKIAYPNDEEIRVQTIEKSNIGGADKTKEQCFKMTRVFNTTAKQTTIFDEMGGLVQSALDGFNVCVFAYGQVSAVVLRESMRVLTVVCDRAQTGSGKTYTMEGPNANDMDDYSKVIVV